MILILPSTVVPTFAIFASSSDVRNGHVAKMLDKEQLGDGEAARE